MASSWGGAGERSRSAWERLAPAREDSKRRLRLPNDKNSLFVSTCFSREMALREELLKRRPVERSLERKRNRRPNVQRPLPFTA